ncbi:MAG: DUF2304 domain-containing protein [Firmicutes bacterium]|nr:DUF2304 domain-containing protein [Bacillota bacterium]
MNIRLRISLIIGIVIYFLVLLKLLKNNRLNLKYTLLWMFTGIVLFIMALLPDVVLFFTKSVGIVEATNGLFAIMIFCILMILISITAIVSKLNDKSKRLIQTVALLEKRLRDVEAMEKGEKDI